MMKHELAIAFARVTEAAALAGYQWLGRGDKQAADGAAVAAMRAVLNRMAIDGEVVIGEGEIDDAPMLYIGEKVGTGVGDPIDIAVDPIEGTRMTAMGQANAMAVLAAGERGALLKAPDMYMEKLVCGPDAKGTISLDRDLMENLHSVAQALHKPITALTVITLAKPRHDSVIARLHDQGVRVFAVPDGDVAASLLVCMPDNAVDVMYCVGGAPEGIIAAAAVRALGGDMQGRLLTRTEAKGQSPANLAAAAHEIQRCQDMGITPGQSLPLAHLARSDNVIFAATGITAGDLLQGVRRSAHSAHTDTLVVHGRSRTVRRMQTGYDLRHQDEVISALVT